MEVSASPALAGLRIGGAILLIGALVLLVKGFRHMVLARQSRKWPRAQGRVVAVECSHGPNFDGGPTFRSAGDLRTLAALSDGGASAEPVFIPRVRYRYRVDGRDLEGASMFIGGESIGHSPQVAAQYLSPYKVGAPVAVFYQADRPERSVLQPGLRLRNAIQFLLGAAGLLAGVVWNSLVWLGM
jgi:hypothetical protein